MARIPQGAGLIALGVAERMGVSRISGGAGSLEKSSFGAAGCWRSPSEARLTK